MWSPGIPATNFDSEDSKYDNMLPPSGHFVKFLDILLPDAEHCVPRVGKCRAWGEPGRRPTHLTSFHTNNLGSRLIQI